MISYFAPVYVKKMLEKLNDLLVDKDFSKKKKGKKSSSLQGLKNCSAVLWITPVFFSHFIQKSQILTSSKNICRK